MSRSYKKYPLSRVEKRFDDKKRNNRHFRRNLKMEQISNGSSYKKYKKEDTWTCYWSKEQAIQDYYADERIQRTNTFEEWLQYWESCVRRK